MTGIVDTMRFVYTFLEINNDGMSSHTLKQNLCFIGTPRKGNLSNFKN